MIGQVRSKAFIVLGDAMIDIVANVGKKCIKGMGYILFIAHSIVINIKRLRKVSFIMFFPNDFLQNIPCLFCIMSVLVKNSFIIKDSSFALYFIE